MDEMLLKAVLKGQYHAGLAMLTSAVAQCPETLWLQADDGAAYWHITYHTLFYTHLYLMPSEAEFQPWEHQRAEYQFMGNVPWPPHAPPNIGEPYTRELLLAYAALCRSNMEPWVDALDLSAPDCGFWWYKVGKLAHQFVNLRHLQHHVGQLADRLRAAGAGRVEWVGSAGPA